MKTQPKPVVYEHEGKTGIEESPEFEKKKLATHAVNVGLKCGQCKYCSVPSNLRTHKAFKQIGETAYQEGFTVVDPGIVQRLNDGTLKLTKADTVMLCTLSDGWSSEAHERSLGSGILQYVLQNTQAQARILTKNVNVRDDFELIEEYRDRVMFGMSITGLPLHEEALQLMEPHASPINERIKLMQEAHDRGFRTYAMFCPLLPGLFRSVEEVEKLFSMAVEWEAEHIWTEPVNARGNGLKLTQATLTEKFPKYTRAIQSIRNTKLWNGYGQWVTQAAQKAARNLGLKDKLSILLYRSSFDERTMDVINKDSEGVIWL